MARRNDKNDLTRREFVKTAAVAAGGAALAAGCGKPAARRRFFTDAEAEQVEAICEQIIPADQDPGAKEAGVANFIDKQLAGFHKKFQPLYRTGLVGVDQTSQNMFGHRFGLLKWDEQTAILKALESDKATGEVWKTQLSREFFQTIRDHTMQGFYGSPRHGGNRNYVSYRMLGIDHPPYVGQNRYKSEG